MHAKKLVRFRIKKQFEHPGSVADLFASSEYFAIPTQTLVRGNYPLRCSLPQRITSFCILARGVERVRGSTNEREWLTGDGAMGNEGSCIALALKVWKAQIERADKLFRSLSSAEVLREIK
jgi:hypothetical protein